jgi:predicted dehydrogenase
MTFKVGIVGCGEIFSAHHVGWSKQRDCEVHAVFDTDPAMTKRVAKHYGVRRACGTLGELIDTCDVVDICTPPDSHTEIALAALDKRRHLLIEKPVVPTVAEWERLAERGREVGAKICGGFNQKFYPQFQLARRWVEEGRIGPVLRVRCEQMLTPETDWMLGQSGHWSHTMSGQRWAETLPHDAYLIYSFVGPVEVVDVAALYGTGRAPDAQADEVEVTLRGARCLASVHYSANCERRTRNVVITGSRGTIEVSGITTVTTFTSVNPARWMDEIGVPFLEAGQKLVQLVPDRARWWTSRFQRKAPHTRLIDACNRYFRGVGPSPTDHDEIANGVRCCEVAAAKLEAARAR